MSIDEFVLRQMGEEKTENGLGFLRRQVLDAHGIDGRDVERLSAGDGIAADQGMGQGRVSLLRDNNLHRALLRLLGEYALGTIGLSGRMDRPQRREHALHRWRKRLIGPGGVNKQRVASHRGNNLGMEKRGGWRLLLEAP